MPPPPTLARLCRVRDLIRECHAEPFRLIDCATEIDLSPWHLLRSFRTVFGETPHEYLTRVRVERALRPHRPLGHGRLSRRRVHLPRVVQHPLQAAHRVVAG